jgi:hypothetical protein
MGLKPILNNGPPMAYSSSMAVSIERTWIVVAVASVVESLKITGVSPEYLFDFWILALSHAHQHSTLPTTRPCWNTEIAHARIFKRDCT